MTSLAIVEKKPPFAGGGCAGGVLFHLLHWHRRLARKRRLFSPRRLLPSSLRSSSPRRLPAPPSPAPQPPPAQRTATAADGAAPGVVARLMGLESWPAAVGAAAAPRPQKQRKVEAMSREGESAVVVVLPPSRRPAAAEPAPAPRSHHAADLPARSPRRSRLVHAAAAKLLEPGARASSRASARLALAYACSSPQHYMDGHSGAEVERSTRVQPPLLPADAGWDNVITSRRQDQHSINNITSTAAVGVASSNTNFDDANTSRDSSDVDAMHKDHRVRTEVMSSCARIRSSGSGAGVRAGEERLLRKRGTPSRPDVAGSVGPGCLVSSTRPAGSARELVSGSRRAAYSGSCPRRELGSITPQRSTHRDVIHRSGLTTTSRSAGNASGPKRGSRKKVGRDTAASNRDASTSVASASNSSVRPVARASSYSKVSEKRGCRSTRLSDTTCERMSAVDAKFMETSPSSVVATSEKEEFSRLLKAKVNELGLSDRVESSDALSGKLTASLLQELISALTNDINTSASQNSNYSDSSAPLNNDGAIHSSNDQSPNFQNCYQGNKQVDSSVTCADNETNQPSPISVLEACFSNDTSSLGSPTEKTDGKEFFMSIGNKMEDFFNLESDIVDLAMSVDATKADVEGMFHGSGKVICAPNFSVHDFKFLEARLHSIGEAISNAELLLGSSLLCSTAPSRSLHSFIIEILETIVDVFGGSESLGLTEEKKYQRINFLFDCVVESLNSKFCNFGKCGYNAWLRLPLTLNRGILKREISEEISNWRETRETAPNQAAEKELEQVTPRWDTCQVEAFDISIAIENDILEGLVDEFAFDQWLI